MNLTNTCTCGHEAKRTDWQRPEHTEVSWRCGKCWRKWQAVVPHAGAFAHLDAAEAEAVKMLSRATRKGMEAKPSWPPQQREQHDGQAPPPYHFSCKSSVSEFRQQRQQSDWVLNVADASWMFTAQRMKPGDTVLLRGNTHAMYDGLYRLDSIEGGDIALTKIDSDLNISMELAYVI
jgi:hypothetical protein